MADVVLKDITKLYPGNVRAVNRVNLQVQDKEFVVLVGPSGCGKTTLLRMIAGLEDISGGDLSIDGRRVNGVAPKDRDIAMVFQNYALYPHMTVYENLSFGMKIRKHPKEEIQKRVTEASQILGIEDLLSRKPAALSGGQRQRVAVGRAIVRKPKVFLFDEPLSNLDAQLRLQMRAEIAALHTRLQATMIYVTHDQVEAMTLGDRIVVLESGNVQQIGAPLEVYNDPKNRFVATFLGSPPINLLRMGIKKEGLALLATLGDARLELPEALSSSLLPYLDQEVLVGIRPEDLEYLPAGAQDSVLQDKVLQGTVRIVEPLGAEIYLHVAIGSHQLIARLSPRWEFKPGQTVPLKPDLAKLIFFDSASDARIR